MEEFSRFLDGQVGYVDDRGLVLPCLHPTLYGRDGVVAFELKPGLIRCVEQGRHRGREGHVPDQKEPL